jgi:hypothetical protein
VLAPAVVWVLPASGHELPYPNDANWPNRSMRRELSWRWYKDHLSLWTTEKGSMREESFGPIRVIRIKQFVAAGAKAPASAGARKPVLSGRG